MDAYAHRSIDSSHGFVATDAASEHFTLWVGVTAIKSLNSRNTVAFLEQICVVKSAAALMFWDANSLDGSTLLVLLIFMYFICTPYPERPSG
jgi:hypothetical protein